MPRKRKTDLVKEEAPNIETKIIDGPKPEEKPVDDQIIEPTNDLVVGDVKDKYIINELKKTLFEPSPNNKKTLTVNKIIPKKQTPFELAKIKANLKVKPLSSSYRGSRTRKNSNCAFSFKVGSI